MAAVARTVMRPRVTVPTNLQTETLRVDMAAAGGGGEMHRWQSRWKVDEEEPPRGRKPLVVASMVLSGRVV